MKAKDILLESRYKLSDTSKERWTDERLLSLLNAGIIGIAKNTTLFIETLIYVVTNGVVDIELYNKALKILRAEYNDEVLPFYSFAEMDKKARDWQLHTGEKVKALVYDLQRNSLLKQYPIVPNPLNPNIFYNQLYGIVTNISYSDIQPVIVDTYGDISGIPNTGLIKIYYVRKHDRITDIETVLQIDELLEVPLVQYVTGMALRDNQDAQNRALSVEELTIYTNMIEEYNIQKSKLFVSTEHTVSYNPIG